MRGLTNSELYEQYLDPNSDLAQLAKKHGIKKRVKKSRKQKRQMK
jgi:hypothetical protein